MAQKLPMDPAQIQEVLASRQGRKLLSLLEGNRDEAVTRAVAAVQAGDYSRAVALLRPYLEARGLGGEAQDRG